MGKRIILIGGDERSMVLCRLLHEKGHHIHHQLPQNRAEECLPLIREAEAVILPTDYRGGPLTGFCGYPDAIALLYEMQSRCFLFCGAADDRLKQLAAKQNLRLAQMLEDEVYLIQNAYLSAKGALQCAMENSEGSLWQASVAVIGTGRIAQALMPLLHCFSTDIRVVGRNAAHLEKARMMGFRGFSLGDMACALAGTEYIFNTIPSPIIHAGDLAHMAAGGLYIELASPPYGCAPKDLSPHGRYHLASGLPGKCCPIAAAKAMLACLFREMEDSYNGSSG